MARKIKIIKINDGGIEKTFTITKHSAMATIPLIWKIASMFSSDGLINKDTVVAYFNGTLLTGIESDDGANDISGKNIYDLIPNAISSVMEKVDPNELPQIISSFLSNTVFNNGSVPMPLSECLDECIDDIETIYTLLKEVFVLSFPSLFEEKKTDL